MFFLGHKPVGISIQENLSGLTLYKLLAVSWPQTTVSKMCNFKNLLQRVILLIISWS